MGNLLPIHEVAQRLACTVAAVRNLIGRGELPAMKISPRRTRILAEDVDLFIQKRIGRVVR